MKTSGEKTSKGEELKDSNEKHSWCPEKTEKRLNRKEATRTEWAGRMAKYSVRKVAGNLSHDKDTDFYCKWESIRGFWTK